MRQTVFEHASTLLIGTVEFVSPDEIKIAIDIEAPESVALNTGGPRPFPRVNGYLLIPVDQGFLVGQVEWITVERSPFPKRRGMQDFGLVDLPYPLRRLSLIPRGMLRADRNGVGFVFRRGSDILPSVGAPALLPTDEQLRAIVESGEKKRVCIGTSPVANDAKVYVDPDRLFGRHLAVLGNTGSGKSCSVAGLIRWSLEQAQRECSSGRPNARFIILDPNGEYSRAFPKDDPGISTRIFKVNAGEGETPLRVPLWFWNSAEWCAFTQASAKTQRPLLRRALREVKAGRTDVAGPSEEEKKLHLRRRLSSMLITLRRDLQSNAIKTEATKFGFQIEAIMADIEKWIPDYPDIPLTAIRDAAKSALDARHKDGVDKQTQKPFVYFVAFTEDEVQSIISHVETALACLGGVVYQEGPDEDVPLAFNGTDLVDHLEILAEQENASQYLDFLVARIRTFLADPRIKPVIAETAGVTLERWLNDYIGGNNGEGGCVSVIDLSLVPTDIVHIVTAVIARMVFEALQRYVKLNRVALPTVLVMEEAHTFIKRYQDNTEDQDTAAVCCQVFERIAREGRKFGLGLVLSSQRPSELSPTVLSQCNTFLLHRISNDRDQELVYRLVPDNLRGLLRELPSLPSQHAILLGWASELPVLVKMNDLPESQRPRSNDPDFWDVWLGGNKEGQPVSRDADWTRIAEDWQASSTERNEGES
ncbi:MAG: Bipolar DNA helicase HerA [Candidatus Carbobacillus altaicus]|uniref:Bipolar DNA helicase HerA n=1 Tax=Candidatus Carbonibacillus altaicus TaxID=2163959 RepID=A0A2R6XZI4_9BACL|nr:MAG: Bipolar DNA helicase HerA [Candidatus Carbobacillus altaicus]